MTGVDAYIEFNISIGIKKLVGVNLQVGYPAWLCFSFLLFLSFAFLHGFDNGFALVS
jgi:hypothetical protein